eukprot:gene28761-35678_t
MWKRTVNETALARVNRAKKQAETSRCVVVTPDRRHELRRAKRTRTKHPVLTFVVYLGECVGKGFTRVLFLAYYPLRVKELRLREHKRLKNVWSKMNLGLTTVAHESILTRKASKPINMTQSMYAGAEFWNNQTRESFMNRVQQAEKESEQTALHIHPDIMAMTLPPIDWDKTFGRHKRPNYLTDLLQDKLLHISAITASKKAEDFEEVYKALQMQEDAYYRAPLIRPILYRDQHEISVDVHDALLRMLRRYVGRTDLTSTVHSQTEEYFSTISQYVKYSEPIHCDVTTQIMKHIFTLYHPGGLELSGEEQAEVLEMYFNWVLDEGLSGEFMPYSVFETWFVELAAWIEACKTHESDFRVPDTPGLYRRVPSVQNLKEECALN